MKKISFQTQILKDSPLFQELSENDIEKFLTCTQPGISRARAGTTVIEEGDSLHDVYVVLSGQLFILHTEYGGHTTIMDYLSPGQLYGQHAVFQKDALAQGKLVAEKDSSFLVFNHSTFYQHCSVACHCHQIITRNMMGLLSGQLTRLNKKISYLSCSSLKKKVALYLFDQSQGYQENQAFEIPFNREDFASYLNTQRPSLSRVLRQMKEAGLIDYERSTFRILDLEALTQVE